MRQRIVLCLAAAVLAAGCRTTPPRVDANAVALEMFRLTRAGKGDAAVELLKAKSAESPALADFLEVAELMDKDKARAAHSCLRAAKAGLHVAEHRYAALLVEGLGVPADREQSFEWLKKAAEGGWPDAQHDLGVAYEAGRPVLADSKVAAGWFRKAAELGHPEAMLSLAFLYADGKGVPEDEALAVEWTLKSAERGVGEAMLHMGYRYSHGRGVPPDWELARDWLLRAFRSGTKEALIDLAAMLATGVPGGHQDEPLAYALFLLAEQHGVKHGAEGARGLQRIMTPERQAAGRKLYEEMPR